ncbi:ubiquitin-like domain-containing protein CIP73 isoform X1 [Silene latifolia]
MDSELSGLVEAGPSEATIEIKIKTMDSQTYTLQVDKQIPVPALKECIASVTGVVTDHQRLICRGKVLKDDQLLSAYQVEDGHTLHLVVREPAPLPSEGSPADSAPDPSFSGSRGQVFQLAPNVVVEAFSMPGQGSRGGISDVSRIVSAVLGSMGLTNTQSSSEMRNQAGDRQEAPAPGTAADTTQRSPEQSGMRRSNDRSRLLSAFGFPAGIPFGSVQAPVILDAVATLSQYLSRVREEFLNNGNVEENIDGASSSQRNSGASRSQSENALPTPASLAELLSNTRQMLNQLAEECLLQLTTQLENQENLTDSVARANAQSGALRTGILLQNLGAYFLELGRTVSTLRLGQSPSEAVVNAGPAIYISPSGPNPLMVQPLPFLPGASFGSLLSESMQSGSGLTNGVGAGVGPRRIDIQIRRVPPATQQAEPVGPQQPSGQRQASPVVIGVTRNIQPATGTSDSPPSNSGVGVRVLPSGTTMAGGSDANRSQPEAGSLEFLYSLLRRNPNPLSGNLSSRTESQVAGDMQTPESTAVQQNVEDSAGDGSGESVRSRTIEIDILTTGGIPSDANGRGQISADIFQMMRGLFPGGELHVESVNSEGIATGVTEQEPPSDTVREDAEARVTEEGLFLSRMLQHVMPMIETSIQRDDPSSSSAGESSEARNTRRQDDDDAGVPSPKRQKTE